MTVEYYFSLSLAVMLNKLLGIPLASLFLFCFDGEPLQVSQNFRATISTNMGAGS